MCPRIPLACDPRNVTAKFEEIGNHLKDRSHFASAYDGDVNTPAFLKIRDLTCSEFLKVNVTKSPHERAARIQTMLDRHIIENEEGLQQAFADIERGKQATYDKFFSLHLFRKLNQDQLNWLPLVYLKLRQEKNDFGPVLPSMKQRLEQLRETARRGADQQNQNKDLDVYFVSDSGEKIYAHSKFLLKSELVKGLSHPDGDHVAITATLYNSTQLHLLLDVIYGTKNLQDLETCDLNSLSRLTDALGYTKLHDAINSAQLHLLLDVIYGTKSLQDLKLDDLNSLCNLTQALGYLKLQDALSQCMKMREDQQLKKRSCLSRFFE